MSVDALVTAAVSPGDWGKRREAIGGLYSLIHPSRNTRETPFRLTEDQCVALVRAAGDGWPEPRSEYHDPRRDLLLVACQSAHPACLPHVLALLPRLASVPRVEWQALMLLAKLPQREAAERWLECYRVRYRTGKGVPPPLDMWPEKGLHADLLLPALIEMSDTSWMERDGDWLSTRLLSHVSEYFVDRKPDAATAAWLVDAAGRALAALPRAERPYSRSRWTKPFARYKASKLVRLLYFAGKKRGLATVRAALRHDDPRVVGAAVIVAAAWRTAVPEASIEKASADPEFRYELYRVLEHLEVANLIPRKWTTQARIAESEMVEWLIADIDAAPDEIKLLKKIDNKDGRYFVFAYRFDPPHVASKDGWMAGVSGAWPKTGKSMRKKRSGETFSDFKPADACTPLQHQKRIVGLLPKR